MTCGYSYSKNGINDTQTNIEEEKIAGKPTREEVELDIQNEELREVSLRMQK